MGRIKLELNMLSYPFYENKLSKPHIQYPIYRINKPLLYTEINLPHIVLTENKPAT